MLATRELDRGYGRNSQLIINAPNDLPSWLKRQLLESSKSIIDEARAKVFIALLITNLGVLVVGGWISYILARRSLEPIEEAHASLERFTADASHELRTPISAMKSEIEVALMEPKISDKDARELLQSNLEELDVLTKLSDNLLTIARLGDQHLVLKKQKILNIAQESIDRVLPLAEKKHILIKNQTDSKISASINHASLVEVLVILLDNAIKYSPERTTITIGTNKKDRSPEVFVEDQGRGIAKTDIPYIFDRFYQADTARSTQNRSGHGLGLSIAKQMIDKMNGSIKVASKWGKGSKFTIQLNP